MENYKKVNFTSSNLSEEKLAELHRILPEAFSENKIDWGKLLAVLGDQIDERIEKFSFTWSGKSNAITGTKKNDIDWYSKMNEIADLTLCMKEILEKGSMQAKRNILSKLGSNLIWNDEKLSISNSNAINKLVEGIKRAKAINSKFEPKNYRINKGLKEKTSSFQPVFSTLLRGEDSNLRPIGYT